MNTFLMHSFRGFGLAGACLAALIGSTSINAAEWHQAFNNPSYSSNTELSAIGWNAYRGTSATDISKTTATPGLFISSATGTIGTQTPGFIAILNQSGQAEVFTLFQTGLRLNNPTTITWNLHSTDATPATIRLLVQVAGSSQWFASDIEFTPTRVFSSFNQTAITSVQQSFSFTTEASAWREFELNPETSVSLGAARTASLPSNTITSIGYYVSTPSSGSVTRIDDLNISYAPNIPEPTTTAILAGAFSLLLSAIIVHHRKHRRGCST